MDLEKMLKTHNSSKARYEKLKRYYEAKHDILNRLNPNANKANNKLVNDYPGYITDVLVGYFMGKPIRYTSKKGDSTYLEKVQLVNEINNEQDHNAELAKNMSIYGEAYELLYVDEEGNVRFTALTPIEVIPKFKEDFSQTLEYAVRTYEVKREDKTLLKAEIYYIDHIEYYEKEEGDFRLLEVKPHYFGRVPIIYYINNTERMGDFERVLGLVDEYDKRASDNANELENFKNAYLKMKNMSGTDEEDFKACDETSMIPLDEDQDVEYLVKTINDTFIQNNIKATDTNIHKFAKVPNLSDENFAGNLSGVAIEFKLWSMEQVAATKERKFKTGIKRRLKLMTLIFNIKGGTYDYKDIDVVFMRNIPQNTTECIKEARDLKGIVDDETLLSRLPFVENPKAILDKLKEDEVPEQGKIKGLRYKTLEEEVDA